MEEEQALFGDSSSEGAPPHIPGPTPTVIGDYQVIKRLGTGSTAELYLARKVTKFGYVSRAVIKQVGRTRPNHQQLQKMLVDEARATSCFDHPNLVRLLDMGETEAGIHIALEYIEGTDLKRVNAKLRQRKEALPFELACYVVSEVLRGVHHAHTAVGPDGNPLEIVHRDVNPANVLIAISGHVKLADFGVVRMRERIQQNTEPGLVKGKYAYLAPEYIAGENCGIQTDIYAAGIMLFELLSGRECFNGSNAYEIMWKIVNKGVPMYRLSREGVPEDLQRIVQKATSMVPERRYGSAQDMANALEAWLMRSGRHATPWVLSVFFNRHELFPPRTETRGLIPAETPAVPAASPPPAGPPPASLIADLGPGLPSGAAPTSGFNPPMPPASPSFATNQNTSTPFDMPSAHAEPRTFDDSLTPMPNFLFESPADFEVPILKPDDNPTLPSVSSAIPAPRVPMPSSSSINPIPAPPPVAAPPPPVRAPSTSQPSSTAFNQPPPGLPSAPPPPVENTPLKPSPAPISSSGQPGSGSLAHTLETPANRTPELRGKLEEMPASDVIQQVIQQGRSGIIEFRCGLIWKRVLVVDGKPTGITSNMGMELIGEHLVKARLINRDDLDRALTASERESRPLTETLLNQGTLDLPTLEVELGRNLASRLQEVLEWRWGTFEFRPQPMKAPRILPKLNLEAMLDHARTIRSDEAKKANGADTAADGNPDQLKDALKVARSVSKATGRGRVERPWRSDKS